jgi:hypothetical protein
MTAPLCEDVGLSAWPSEFDPRSVTYPEPTRVSGFVLNPEDRPNVRGSSSEQIVVIEKLAHAKTHLSRLIGSCKRLDLTYDEVLVTLAPGEVEVRISRAG